MALPRRPFVPPRLPALAFRLGYVLVVVLATVAEPTSTGTLEWHARLARAFAFDASGTTIVDAARNILLFVGWGVVWVLTSAGKARPILLRATLTGALLSASVETVQLFSPSRFANALDVITNTTGALLGSFCTVLLVLAARAGLRRRSYLGIPGLLVAGPYFFAAFLEASFPIFRQQRLPAAWGSPGERLDMALREFGWPPWETVPWLDVLLFLPAGLLAVAALVELQLPRRRALLSVLVAGTGLFALAELVRGASGYPISWRAFATHVAGLALGASLSARWLPAFSRTLRGGARALAVLAGYAFFYALWALRPFSLKASLGEVAQGLTEGHLVPLIAYRERVDLFTTGDVAILAFLLLPVGGVLAVWPLRRAGWLRGVLPAVYLVAVLELLQLLIAGRMFDMTDIMVASAAATVGLLLVRRAGYQPYGSALPATPRLRATSWA